MILIGSGNRAESASLRIARSRSGLTLIELLVVIVIVGLLAGLVTTVTVRARQAALQVEATSKLRGIGFAIQSYVDDHSGKFPGRLRGYQKPVRINNYQLITFIEEYLSGPKMPNGTTVNDLYISNAYRQWLSNSMYNTPTTVSGADAYVMYTNHTDPKTGKLYQPWGEPGKEDADALTQIEFYEIFNPTQTRALWDAQGTVRSPQYGEIYPGRNVLFFDWHVSNVPAP